MSMDWWQKVADKTPPKTDAEWVLCAWRCETGAQPPHYEVLLHWPDGAWSGTNEETLCAEELPEWWVNIKPPNVGIHWPAGYGGMTG
jgi:hypothetical protein